MHAIAQRVGVAQGHGDQLARARADGRQDLNGPARAKRRLHRRERERSCAHWCACFNHPSPLAHARRYGGARQVARDDDGPAAAGQRAGVRHGGVAAVAGARARAHPHVGGRRPGADGALCGQLLRRVRARGAQHEHTRGARGAERHSSRRQPRGRGVVEERRHGERAVVLQDEFAARLARRFVEISRASLDRHAKTVTVWASVPLLGEIEMVLNEIPPDA